MKYVFILFLLMLGACSDDGGSGASDSNNTLEWDQTNWDQGNWD